MSNTSIDVQPADQLRYPVNPTTVLSPQLFAIIGAAYLNGFITLYAFKFHRSARQGHEDVLVQIVVYTMLLLLFLAIVSRLIIAQWTFATRFGAPVALGLGGAPQSVGYGFYIISGVATNTCAQGYFAIRAFRMNGRRRWFGALLVALLLTNLAFGEVAGIAIALGHHRGEPLRRIFSSINWARAAYCYRQTIALMGPLTLTVAAFNDATICLVICYRLWAIKAIVDDSAAAHIVVRLMRLSVASSAVSSLWAITVGVLHVVNTPRISAWSQILILSISEVYAISALFAAHQKHLVRDDMPTVRGSSWWPSRIGVKPDSRAACPAIEVVVGDKASIHTLAPV